MARRRERCRQAYAAVVAIAALASLGLLLALQENARALAGRGRGGPAPLAGTSWRASGPLAGGALTRGGYTFLIPWGKPWSAYGVVHEGMLLTGRRVYGGTIWHSMASVRAVSDYSTCWRPSCPPADGCCPLDVQRDGGAVRHGAVVHVCKFGVANFVAQWAGQNRTAPIVLVYHNTDAYLPGQKTISEHEMRRLLADPRLLHLYAQNVEGAWAQHAKVTPLPIGLGPLRHDDTHVQHHAMAAFYHRHRLWPLAQPFRALSVLKSDAPRSLALVDFQPRERDGRAGLRRMWCPEEEPSVEGAGAGADNPLDGHVTCVPFSRTNDLVLLYEARAAAKFVLSPRGNGEDSLRTYETLLVGSYPVLLRAHLDVRLFEGLPVVVLERWEDATPELLRRTYAEFAAVDYWPGWERMFAEYWADRMRGHARHPTQRADDCAPAS